MSSDRFKKYAESAKKTVYGAYDSDEELDEETRKKIKQAGPTEGDRIRDEAWDKADFYPKLKRTIKGAWERDIRKPKK